MPINTEFLGHSFPPTEPYEVCREKIREFADAIGDPNPVYRDREAATALGHPDVLAPPTFAIVLAFQMSTNVVLEPDLGVDYSRVVHGEQRFVYNRPIRAGDVLVGVPTIADIRTAGRNELLTVDYRIFTVDGEPVCTTSNTLVVRGTAPRGPAR